MQLLRKVSSFGAPLDDLKTIYILFVRSHLEQSATVWHSNLTQENRDDLERVQKSAMKIIFKEKYQSYEKSLQLLEIETLEYRREQLCLSFAQKCLKNPKMKKMFPINPNYHNMETRGNEKYHVQLALNGRLKKSSIIYMQNLLNQNEKIIKNLG